VVSESGSWPPGLSAVDGLSGAAEAFLRPALGLFNSSLLVLKQ
jgi:hypothetical protein